jgi:hypothetical protein
MVTFRKPGSGSDEATYMIFNLAKEQDQLVALNHGDRVTISGDVFSAADRSVTLQNCKLEELH